MGGLVKFQSAFGRGPKTVRKERKQRLTVPPSLVNTVNADTLLHLFDFQTDETSVRVAVTVELDQEGNGLLLAALGEEPTGRLGNEPHSENDDNTGKALADEGNAPLPVGAHEVGAVGDQSGGNAASEPTAVVET